MSSTSSTNDTGIVSVSLRRSGGLKPINVSRIFSTRTAPPKGYTAADVDQVIFAAQRFVGSGASVRPIVVSACCDRYTYAITIVWANGHSKTFTTTDGVAQPKLFDLLLRAVA
jgi:hypothetical protein